MPTYEYACTACQHAWEHEQSIKDDPLKECPECHEATARRQISGGGGFILKGSGWYSDLYSSPSNKKPDAAAKPADTKAESKGEAKTETKTETPKSTDTTSSSPAASSSTSTDTKTGSAKTGSAAAA